MGHVQSFPLGIQFFEEKLSEVYFFSRVLTGVIRKISGVFSENILLEVS